MELTAYSHPPRATHRKCLLTSCSLSHPARCEGTASVPRASQQTSQLQPSVPCWDIGAQSLHLLCTAFQWQREKSQQSCVFPHGATDGASLSTEGGTKHMLHGIWQAAQSSQQQPYR